MPFKIFPDILKEIEKLPLDEQQAMKRLFVSICPTYAMQKELLRYLFDIRERDKKSIIELIKMVKNTIDNPVFTREQKLENIRNFFREYRFPLLTKAEKVFNEKIKDLKLPLNCKIIPPPCWEGDVYEIRFHFKNNKDFIETLRKLLDISQKKAWQQLINGGWFEEIFSQKNFDR